MCVYIYIYIHTPLRLLLDAPHHPLHTFSTPRMPFRRHVYIYVYIYIYVCVSIVVSAIVIVVSSVVVTIVLTPPRLVPDRCSAILISWGPVLVLSVQ